VHIPEMSETSFFFIVDFFLRLQNKDAFNIQVFFFCSPIDNNLQWFIFNHDPVLLEKAKNPRNRSGNCRVALQKC
jgi:hypothetical protein